MSEPISLYVNLASMFMFMMSMSIRDPYDPGRVVSRFSVAMKGLICLSL